MIKKLFSLSISFLLIILSVTNCYCDWITTQNNYKFFSKNSEKYNNNFQYLWEGQHFDEVVNGKGILKTYSKDTLISEQEIDAYYGSIDENDIIITLDNKKIIGNTKENKMDGYAVQVSDDENIIYMGFFKNGKPEGRLSKYNNNQILYDGMWKEGKYNGNGILYMDGGKYYGEFVNGKRTGYGCMEYKNGDKYEGNWLDDKRQGKGVLHKENYKYEGEFVNGAKNGYGCVEFSNGDKYEGNWLDDKFNGNGILYKDDYKYEGKFIDGEVTYGCRECKNGDKYEGNWINGKFNGKGVIKYANGTSIYGNFENGKLEGSGILYNEEKNIYYIGNWKNNSLDGEGYRVYSDSSVYSGQWKDGEKNGYGEVVYSNGDAYFGNWKDDKRNGYGRYLYKNGEKYEGVWENDLQNGYGIYTSKNYKYSGSWECGWCNGLGKAEYYDSDGNIKDWYVGNFVENKKFGKGEYHFKNGNIYDGEFINDTFNGYGIFYFYDGNRYEGEFENGKIKGEGSLYLNIDNEKVIITAIFDGTAKLPKQEKVTILFENGDLYEGEIDNNGKPTNNGIWKNIKEPEEIKEESKQVLEQKTQKSFWQKVKKISKPANDFYKRHENVIGTVVIVASIALTVAAVCNPTTAWIPIALYTINAVDAGLTISSAVVDENWSKAGTELASNFAFFVAPTALKKVSKTKLVNNLVKNNVIKKLSPLAIRAIVSNRKTIKSIVRNQTDKVIQVLNKNGVLEKVYVSFKRAFISEKNQFVTSKQVNEAIKKGTKFIEGEAKDAGILKKNMIKAGTIEIRTPKWIKSVFSNPQTHHIVAGNAPAAEQSRAILKKFGIDINAPINGICLPQSHNSIFKGVVHRGSHVSSYHDFVYKRLRGAKTKQQVEYILDDIKKDLYKGSMSLYKKQIVNTTFSSFIILNK